jgi:hypothetical protein
VSTNSELITRLRQAKKDTESAAARQKRTDATYAGILTNAQGFINRTMQLLRKEFSLTLEDDTREYSTDDDFVCFPDDRLKERSGLLYWDDGQLEPTTPELLDSESAGWRGAASGTPSKFYLQLNSSGGTSNLKIGLHHKPNSSFVDDHPTLTYYGVYRPAAIAANSNRPFDNHALFEELEPELMEYALWILEIEDGNHSRKAEWLEAFVEKLEEKRGWLFGRMPAGRGMEFDRRWKR